MNIAVMSPHTRHIGNTTVAGLLALELASRGMKTCLTNLSTAEENNPLNHYFGFDSQARDSTSAPSKLAKMLKERIINTDSVTNYCKSVAKDCDILSVADRKMDDDLLKTLVWFELTNFPHDVVIYDVDIPIEKYNEPYAQLLFERVDFIIWVFNQSILEVRDFKVITPKITKLLNKPSLVVINKFDRQVSSIKDVQSEIAQKELSKETSWLRLRYNPMVCKYTNGGSLHYLHAAMKNADYAVLNLDGDLAQIAGRVMKFSRRLKSQYAKNKSEIRQRELENFQASVAQQKAEAEAPKADSKTAESEATDTESNEQKSES